MKRHGFALLGLAIIAIAAWAYNVNYNTRTTLDRVHALRTQIAGEREAIQVLRVEWAYLNTPERLARLVRQHHDRLLLVPMAPEAMQEVAAAPFVPNGPLVPEASAIPGTSGFPVPVARPVGWRP